MGIVSTNVPCHGNAIDCREPICCYLPKATLCRGLSILLFVRQFRIQRLNQTIHKYFAGMKIALTQVWFDSRLQQRRTSFFSCVLILLTKRPLISFKRGSTSQSLNCCNIILFIISNGHLLPSVWLLHVPKRKAILRQIMNSSPFSVFI